MATSLIAQVPDSAATDSAGTEFIPQDSLNVAADDTTLEKMFKEPEPKPITIIPWQELESAGSHTIINDSLLRWQIWPNWGDFQAYRRNVISFRQGTSGRIDAYHINGYEPHEQQIEMEGISINNPITGLPNFNLIPHRKIGSQTENFAGNYYSDIRLRDYYIIKPISYLNYDEADGNYRNLEFLVSQNFTERTNLEVSYWDRRDGDYYPNSGMEGSQLVGRVYHHLNDNYLLRGFYFRNQIKKDEPFGYNVSDPAFFIFDEYGSQPLSTNGNSELTRWDLAGGIYHRKDTSSAEDAGFEATFTKNKNVLRFTGDTLSWDIISASGKLFKQINWKGFEIRGEADGALHSANESTIISQQNWATYAAKASLGFNVADWVQFYGKGNLDSRSDGKNGFDLTGGFKSRPLNWAEVGGSISRFSRIPTMQAMYWDSKNYQGNSSLANETGISAAGTIDFQLGPTLQFGASGRFKKSQNATFLTQENSFTNSQDFEKIAGTIYGLFENHLFEIESSGTVQQYNYSSADTSISVLNHQDPIVWLRNSAFVKGYVFDRAAYLKIGVKTLLSPLYYNARTYNTELGYWQGNSIHQQIPPFFRLDGELSARVRRIMVVIRWENALDGIGQAGYFESAGFPMPPRRLIVGIRAQFRN
ncbi:MAG: putative porin [Balneolaceae bacterium]